VTIAAAALRDSPEMKKGSRRL